MFKKIVSHLAFSPALIQELGFYAKRLRKEEITRKTGLILTALALVVQSFAVFQAPESANAASSSDLVYGGIHTRSQLLAAWDGNKQNFRDMLQHAGITRENLVSARDTKVHTRQGGKDVGWQSWNRTARFGLQRGEVEFKVGSTTLYSRPLAEFDTGRNRSGSGSWYPSFVGTKADGKPFAIMKACANIMIKEPPKQPPAPKYPKVKIDKRVNEVKHTVVKPGTDFSYQLRVSNVGDTVLKNTAVGDNAPAGVTFVRVSHGSLTGSRWSYTIPQLNVGDTFLVTITARAATYKDGTIVNTACVDAQEIPGNSDGCDTATIELEKPKPQPIATCTGISHKISNRTSVTLTATSQVQHGATVSGYTFIIKNSAGKEVLRKKIASRAATATVTHTIAEPGTYTTSAIVHTSLGDKTSTACESPLMIEAEKKCPLNPALPINHPDCQPCPGDATIWVKDEKCAAQIVRNKSARNLTSNTDATAQKAKSSDRIEYTLTARNDGKAPATITPTDDLSDVLEYAELYDNGGGSLNKETKVLSWPQFELKPGEKRSIIYVVKMKPQLSAMARGSSDPSSYDCRITNVFGNSIEVVVDCPAPKVVEQTVAQLPKTGPGENMTFAGILAAVVTYFYFRSRQLNKEVRIIRQEATAGTI